MGWHSSSDEDSSRRLRKRKKRRSRSRSRSMSSVDSEYSSSKHKKSKRKHKRKSRSRSMSEERYKRRDRSSDRRRRSRSSDRRRSRSTERSRHSRSHSRGRGLRSDSRNRYYSRRRSPSWERSRKSRSQSGSISRRSSPDRKAERTPNRSESNTMDSIPGFQGMTPAEQAQARMKMALKAAAMADEKLKEQTGMYQSSYLNPSSSKDFADAVASIELDNFSPSVFKSSRSTKSSLKESKDSNGEFSMHDLAMFGAVGSSIVFSKTEPIDRAMLQEDPEAIVDASLNCDPEEKMQRWIQKLTNLRRKKLEGELFNY